LQPGTILNNKYRIEESIKTGGFGCVYRAYDQLTGEDVAIKELVRADREAEERFIQEARVTLRLTHPHIARTYDIFQEGNTYYLPMEYLPGSLTKRLQDAPLPVEEVLQIASELCEALDYAHQQGTVHCDIKPANVLFDARGRVRLADFGIAHISDRLMSRGFNTGPNVAMGTLQYMAPEQLDGVRDDPRVDIYAMGALLYEALTGRTYLEFDTRGVPTAQAHNINLIKNQQPRPLRKVNPNVPGWLAHVIKQALRKKPEKRYSTARALQEALEPPEEPKHLKPLSNLLASIKDAVPSMPSPQGISLWVWALGGVAVLALVMGIVTAVTDNEKPGLAIAQTPPVAVAADQLTNPSQDSIKSRRSVTGTASISLVFVSGRNIYYLSSEGEVAQITQSAGEIENQDPIMTPSGGVLFTSNRGGKREIYHLTKESEVAQVTRSPGGTESWEPALVADGGILFTSNRDGKREIYHLTREGDVQRVTRSPGDTGSWGPASAADGSILFTSDRDGKREIYHLTLEGDVVQVTRSPGNAESWGPTSAADGSILFTSDRDGKREIYHLTLEGDVVQVTRSPGNAESWDPALAADGGVLFTSDRDGKQEVYHLTKDGEVERATHTYGDGGSQSPGWKR
jgi:serine/threonine protein kinase